MAILEVGHIVALGLKIMSIATGPPSKAYPEFADITLSLTNAGVITEVQWARLDVLYRIGNTARRLPMACDTI